MNYMVNMVGFLKTYMSSSNFSIRICLATLLSSSNESNPAGIILLIFISVSIYKILIIYNFEKLYYRILENIEYLYILWDSLYWLIQQKKKNYYHLKSAYQVTHDFTEFCMTYTMPMMQWPADTYFSRGEW